MKKGLLMTALITGTLMCASTGAFAEELQEYTLDQMVVTATRTEARELEIPAAVSVINAKEIENSGAKTAYEGLALPTMLMALAAVNSVAALPELFCVALIRVPW